MSVIVLNPTLEPKPCPFCGDVPQFGAADEIAPAGIFCMNEDCGVQPNIWGVKDEEFEDILKLWNCPAEVAKDAN